MNPKLVSYIHALVIDCISIVFKDSINTRALEPESVMVDAYTKMKPDSFQSQLQTILTTYYEDIKGVQGASGCSRTKVVKCRFEDQEDDAGNVGADADAGAGPARPAACREADGGCDDEAAASPAGKTAKQKRGKA